MRKLILTVLFTGSLLAQQKASPTLLDGTFDRSSDSPLAIQSWTQGQKDYVESIRVQNRSTKTITKFQLGWVLLVPDGCAAQSVAPVVSHAEDMDRVSIDPGQSTETQNYHLWIDDLFQFAHDHHAGVLHVQIGVTKVEFSDGTEWLRMSEDPAFDRRALQFERSRCSGGRLVESTLASNCVNESSQSPKGNLEAGLDRQPGVIHYTCATSSNSEYCTNNDTKCTNSGCSDGNVCAKQACGIVQNPPPIS
jgi:hypothetical protein